MSDGARATGQVQNRAKATRRKIATSMQGTYAGFVPVHPKMVMADDDEPFWRDLPDMLQAQVLVMLDSGRPTKKQPALREPEKLLWAGTPHLRVRTVLLLLALWAAALVGPAMLLVELVDEIGGWLAMGWAFVSLFVFVPRISRGSREVFALTSHRAFSSKRSMWCSIHSAKVAFGDVATAELKMHKDGTGTFTFSKVKAMYRPVERVTFDRVRDVRGASRVLSRMLPVEVATAAGFSVAEPSEGDVDALEM